MKKKYLLVFIMLVKLSVVGAQNYPTYVPSNGLDAWYSFTGNAKDSSGNNNHGTVSGATLTAGKSGIANTAYSFNGSSNTIVLANPFLGGGQVSSFTIHSVVKLNSTINGGVIWGKSFFWGEVFLYVDTDNSIRISWANTYSGNKYSKMASQPNVIQTGVWYNVDIVYSNSSGQIYLNGAPITTNLEWIAQGGAVLSTTQIESRCNFNQTANSSEIGVFSNAGSPGTYFNGIIDEFGIWNRALTAQEISILYGRNCVISNFNPLQDTTKVCGTSTSLNAGAGFANYTWNTGVTTQSINVNSSGSKYLLTVANADGCSAKDSSYVDILNSSIVNNDTATCNVNSITLSTNSPATSSQIVLYDFSSCNLNGFTAELTEGSLVGSATSTPNGLTGCGVNLIRPAILTTVRQDFSYGTYEVDAKGGDGTANQYFNVMNIINLDCRPSGTDDVGYKFYFNGVNVATANGTNPVSYPGWYHIKVRITPDSISCWLGSTLIYNATYQTPLVNPYGPMGITTYSSSFYDNLKYTPYNNRDINFLWSTGETTNSINVTPIQTTKYYSTMDNGISSCKDSVTVNVNAISSFNPLQDTLKVCGTITSLNAGVGFATYSWNTGATSQTISPTASSKYKVTVTNAQGCTAIDSTYLSIVNANIINNDTTICKGSSSNLTSNGSYNFLWSTGATTNSINVSPTQTTKYYCIVSNGTSSCMDSVTVTVSDISSFNPLQDTLKICGTITSLNAGVGFATYSWNTGATSQTISPTASAKYIVTVTNAPGCSAIDSTYLSIVNADIINNDTTICKGSGIKLSIDSSLILKSKYSQISLVPINNFDWHNYNVNNSNRSFNIPLGSVVFNSIPFYIEPQGNNAWNAHYGNTNPTLSINKSNIKSAYFLINTFWGPTNGQYSKITFNFSDGSSFDKLLISGVDCRDFLNNTWANTINNTSTVNVFTNSTNGVNRLDMMKIDLPSHFQNKTLSQIAFLDYGGNTVSRLIITGVTLESNLNLSSIIWSTGETTNSINVSPTQTTQYYCTVSNGISSCKDSVTVTVSDIGTFNPLQDTTKVCGASATLDAGVGFASYSWNTGATTQFITPTASGKYIVTVSNASGCKAIDSTYISIVNANILNNDTTICKGSSIKLSVDSVFGGSSACAKSSLPINLQNGLVAYFPFCGNANDESGNGNNGTVNGATLTSDRFGKINSSYYFSSSGCNTSIQANVNTGSIQTGLTISLWIYKIGEGCISPRLFEFWPGSDGPGMAQWYWSFPNPTNELRIGSWTSNGFECKAFLPAPSINTWSHIVYTNDGRVGKFYQEGQLIATVASSGNPILAGNLAIGRMNHPDWDAFNGKIDDFGIWNRALTESEVQQLHTGGAKSNQFNWSTSDTTSSINVSPSQTTKYYCTVSDGITSCIDSVTVTVESLDTSLIVLDPPKVCTNGGSVRMKAGIASTYKWLKNGVVIPSATSSLYSAVQTGIYRAVVTNNLGCSDTSRAVDVTLYPIPIGNVKSTSNNICSGSTLLLTATGGDTYQWQLNGNNISGANSATYAASVPGVYTATLISSANCIASAEGSVSLSLINKPTALFTYQNNCLNVPVIFTNGSNSSQSGAVTYNWSFGNGVISSQSSPSDQIYKAEGSFVAKLIITPTACPSLSDSLSKDIKIVAPELGVRYPTINVIKNVPYLLQARNIGVNFSWLPLSGISDPRISNPSFNSSVGADYRINIKNTSGCTVVDSLLIRAFDQTAVYVPKAFAPNGNGSNDLLRPILVRITSINYFRIYNRWGQLIFQTKNIGEGWDGRFKGAAQPTETYTWVFEGVDYNGKIIRESGKSTLLR
jgi:gliding motility-associated-like protein